MTQAIDRRIPSITDLRAANVPLPDEAICIYVGGSLASGMAHAASDIDLFVITGEPFAPEDQTGIGHASTEAPTYPIVIRHLPQGRCDVEYWQEQQVEDLIALFAEGNDTLGFTIEDVDFLYRLRIGIPLKGEEWLERRRAQLQDSRFAPMVAQRNFGAADSLFEDSLGMLAVDDELSAVLAAHEGFGRVVDGILAHHGEFSPRKKWRAQKMLRAQPPALSFDDYWRAETMSDLHAGNHAQWVRELIELSRDLMMEVEI